MSPTPSAAVSRRRDPRSSSTPAPVNIGSAPRVGQHAGTDTGSGTAESSDRVITGALADAHANLGNDFLAHSPVFGADLSVGMGLDPELAPVDSATALIQQHTMGAVALAMAGFESSDLVPGSAPLSVMRQLMRRGSQAEAEGLDTERAAGRIGSRGGTPLPEAVRVRMERAFGHDFSHVRIHTDGGGEEAPPGTGFFHTCCAKLRLGGEEGCVGRSGGTPCALGTEPGGTFNGTFDIFFAGTFVE